MAESENVLDKIREFLAQSPLLFGILLVLFGIFLLLSAIYDRDWLFEKSGAYNMEKVAGWVDFFGRKTARIFVGVLSIALMASGIVWAIIG